MKALAKYFVAAVVLIAVGAVFVFRPSGRSLTAAIYSTVIVDLTNNDRAGESLNTLKPNALLAEAAKAKANDMASKGYFAHTSPEGITPWYWFKKAGYKYVYAGENLAINFSDSLDVENAWMNSPTHRANILNGHYTDIGVGIADGYYQGRQVTFVVQEFGSTASTSLQIKKIYQSASALDAILPIIIYINKQAFHFEGLVL